MNIKGLFIPEITAEMFRKRFLEFIEALMADGEFYNIEYDPKRKKGQWIENALEYYKAVNEKVGGVDEDTPYFADDIACPECLALFNVIHNETDRFNFCPNCGADMRGEDNE